MKKLSYYLATLYFFCLLPYALADSRFLPQRPYYTKSFFDEVQKPQQEMGKIKEILFNVLSKAHIPKSDFDELADECTSSNCYRQRTLDYRYARQMLFGKIDLIRNENGYAIRDVYCSRTLGESDFSRGKAPGPNKIPDVRVLNTEHTWPQSKFSRQFPTDLQKGDLHILYPVSPKANSSRSNHPFSNVAAIKSSPCNGATLGYTGTGRTLYFEPPRDHKGNAARAIFYFSLRYRMPVDEGQEAALREWAHQDPVDEEEIRRNEEIFRIQGNRNPFVDYPELAQSIQDF